MNPTYSKLSPSELSTFVSAMVAAIGTGPTNPFGIDHSLIPLLQSETTALVSSTVAAESARKASTQAYRDRDDKASYVAGLAAQITRVALASSASDAELASLGLSRPSSSRARVVPRAASGLIVTVQPTGDLALSWTGNNPYGVIYRVEAQVGSDPEFRFVDETTAQKIVLSGFRAGVPTALRILASKNGQVSAPSGVASAYYAPDAPALRLAA